MANEINKTDISENEWLQLISRLVNELLILRTKLGMSRDELANLLGIFSQTYSSIETKSRKMS